MKKITVLLIVVVMLLALTTPVFAFGPGGAPANHPGGPFSGFDWGGAVADFAIDNPIGFAGHIAGGFTGFSF
jgi:hypothetical protein